MEFRRIGGQAAMAITEADRSYPVMQVVKDSSKI